MSAYLIANYDVNDDERYQTYLGSALPTIAGHDGEILVAGSANEAVEGNPGEVTVVVRFPSMEALRGWYASPEYQQIVSLRTEHTAGSLVFADEFAMPGP